ncbi:MAG: hypothetical protein EOM80_17315 [Erysipelotrichia bacterium]|nr:hypothetical protein [Erysipelotrichia bacterium]
MLDYFKQYEPEHASRLAIAEFLDSFYLSIRRRWLEKTPDKTVFVSNRPARLNADDLMLHVQGKKTIGVCFPDKGSSVIGIDIDSLDRELLNRIYSAMIRYGVTDGNMLMSFSGKKGYHLDIFLSDPIDRKTFGKFFTILLNDCGINDKVELFGGNGKAYKLPLGVHQETGAYCFPCDEWGNEIPVVDAIGKIQRLDSQVIRDCVALNYDAKDYDVMNLYAELLQSTSALPIYAAESEKYSITINSLLKSGVQDKGRRNQSIFLVSVYLKEELGLSADECSDRLNKWIATSWNPGIVDKEVHDHVKYVVKSVYRKSWFRRPTVATPEIREVFSIKTCNRLETAALRQLYFILLRHAKVFADKKTGIFFMTFTQMSEAGAGKNRGAIHRHIKKLMALGKLEKAQSGRFYGCEKSYRRSPNEYRLPELQPCAYDGNLFTICQQPDPCADCNLKACIHLLPADERKEFLSGWEFRKVEPCKYQKLLPLQ